MTIIDLEKKRCTGCGSCMQSCPEKCIKMEKDEEGFLYPILDKEKCIGCGKCAVSCPQMQGAAAMNGPEEVYAAFSKDQDILYSSTSGGVFGTAAKKILQKGGVVFGVQMGHDFRAGTCYIEKEEDLPKLQGNKYMQADTGIAYREAAYFLKTGREVLFAGTPCQIAGLRSFLGKEYENLYTMDIVCHGVPSPELFVSYVHYLERKYGQRMIRWSFRDKGVDGWKICDLIEFEKKTKKQRETLDPYTRAFLNNETLRESCYVCPYSKKERCGDITCGDFWGIERHHPDIRTEQGVSVLLVNTQKGRELLSMISDDMEVTESRFKWAAAENMNLVKPSQRPEKRGWIYKKWEQKPMRDFVNEDLGGKPDVKEIIRQYVPAGIRRALKTVCRKVTGGPG